VVSGDHDYRKAEPPEAVCEPSTGVWGNMLVLPEITTDCHGVDAV
jgi:hypothetical protein